MRNAIALIIVLLGCCVAQDAGADYPAGVRIIFSDGTATQLLCAQDGSCRIMRNNAAIPTVSRINLGFSGKHGYTLLVQ